MEHLDFILWMILYPLSVTLDSYISSKQRKIEGLEPYDKTVKVLSALTSVGIWIYVACLVY